MMVTDMGNNRVNIFRKMEVNNERRFRFYRFLEEEEDDIIQTPLSITVNRNLGKVYVLNGKNEGENREILVYSPKVENKHIKYSLIYKLKALKTATKIRIDDRGFIVISENNPSKIKIIKDVDVDSA